MSRRRASRAIEEAQAIEESLPPGWDPEDVAILDDWRESWAHTTNRVTEQVWRERGARMYATHINALLRDDLRSWLLVKAVEISLRYQPDWAEQCPEDRWAGYLYRALTEESRHHFADQIGRSRDTVGEAAIRAHNLGMYTLDVTGDAIPRTAVDGEPTVRIPLRSADVLNRDPEWTYLYLERLEERTEAAREYSHHHPPEHRAPSPWCSEPGCLQASRAKGMCQKHYLQHRARWAVEDDEPRCSIPGCARVLHSRGLCNTHVKQFRKGILPAEFQEYVQPARQRRSP